MPTDQQRAWLQKALGLVATRNVPPTTAARDAKPGSTARSPGGGNGGGASRGVRPSEMISGASGVQYSYGENTNETGAEGGDFAEGSRQNAEANDHDSSYSGYAEGSNPMQSPVLGTSSDFAVRYGIGFLCSTYPKGWGNLSDIADYSKPNSTYLRAFSGMAKTKQYKNPTRNQVLAGIKEWITNVKKALPSGAQGELVVSFQGHGAHGSFFSSDGKEIKASEMLALATAAEKNGVSITYVLDACFSGGAVPVFQDHAGNAVDRQIDENVEGAGQVCSEENTARAEELRNRMAHARELILFSKAVAQHGDTLNARVSDIEAQNTVEAWDRAMKENQTLIDMIQSMKNQFHTNMDFGNDPRMKLDQISAAFETVLTKLRSIEPQTSFDYTKWTGAVGRFQDLVSDGANRIIRLLQQQAQSS